MCSNALTITKPLHVSEISKLKYSNHSCLSLDNRNKTNNYIHGVIAYSETKQLEGKSSDDIKKIFTNLQFQMWLRLNTRTVPTFNHIL